jgi:hypothetical protein
MMADIRKFYSKRLEIIIAEDPLAAVDIVNDRNKINQIVMVNFWLRIIKLGLIIVNICYFLGLIWYIICELGRDYYLSKVGDWTDEQIIDHNTENFIDLYEL